jgi:hypothetical protein
MCNIATDGCAARSATSGSGGGIWDTICRAVGLLVIDLPLETSGGPSLLAAVGRRGFLAFFGLAMAETPLSAFYSNSRGGQCLAIVGTEGAIRPPA